MRSTWALPEPYPGDPYVHNEFKQCYSDHNPVAFRLEGRGWMMIERAAGADGLRQSRRRKDPPSPRGIVRWLKATIFRLTCPAGGGRIVDDLRLDGCVIYLVRHEFTAF